MYKAFEVQQKVGDGTVGELVDWLEKLIQLLFPENGIEYFSSNEHAGSHALKRFHDVPKDGCGAKDIHHIACYARDGSNEGRIIEVGVYLRDETLKNLTWIKTFGSEDECWLIARALSSALTAILVHQQVPAIVSMAAKVPRGNSWERSTNLKEDVVISTTQTSITVATASGLILDAQDWSDKHAAAHYVDAWAHDWALVLTNTKARFKQVQERRLVVEGLPGYVISDRGVADITGYYVLPPGGNPLDDRTYLGYFETGDKAIQAAELHQALAIAQAA